MSSYRYEPRICKGFIGEEKLSSIKNSGEKFREIFLNFMTSTQDAQTSNQDIKKLLNAKKRFYKNLDNCKNNKYFEIMNSKQQKTITKDKFVDYYA